MESEGNPAVKDIMQIQAVLAFGAIALDIVLTHFLFLLYLCIMIKFTLVSLGVRISTSYVSQLDLCILTLTKLQVSKPSPERILTS